jgi:allantoinase
VSSGEGLEVVAEARAAGVAITAETCPHYLTFTADEVPDGATAFKCAPPIRAAEHRERLWNGLRVGTCDLIASDHSPAPPSVKAVDSGDFLAAWGGIASLELSLAAVWTEARQRGFTPSHIARWMSERPARLSGLDRRKGAIRTGCDADLVFWDPDATWNVNSRRLQQRHTLTPYDGRTMRGTVHATFLRGERVWDGRGLVSLGQGRLV